MRRTAGSTRQRRDHLIERFDLDPTKRIRDYSKGNRQKVALIAALAAEADLLILDEPTSGLDPLMEQAFQQCVRERRTDGVTVLLSSHILGEVEALADRVSIIRRGRTVTTGSLADLRRHTRTSVHAVTVDEPEDLAHAEGVADCVCERLDGQVDTRFTIDADHLDATIGTAARRSDPHPDRHPAEPRRAVPAHLRGGPRRPGNQRNACRGRAMSARNGQAGHPGAVWAPWSGSSGAPTAAASSSG